MTHHAAYEGLTVRVEATGEGVAALLDDATERLLELEERGEYPTSLSVPQGTYDIIVGLRSADLSRGVPLIVLGLPLVAHNAP